MNTTKEQIIVLKDGRTIFKTHNGFKSFVQTAKGEVTEITSEYYDVAKRNSINKLKATNTNNIFYTGRVQPQLNY